ncbi:oxidized purine nucleoside triphosphate hydrolase [Nomia melanderi]|uniref:oxidized purine nucleoside triphosphate hydrolase n=1 Tax=Nomia melanderi TaxID=2448451 RepID=UPI00130475D8|nr:7,8-dihydro-8-oxoguanine triphosphatase-like [Nomia melanderi]XP_031849212.1 7,8-dihydro-8-oxoguanine triphosphatase-like [Nomia melanderi]XP_031849224.1 7,8-dihydro-8-oxoguanine triphosphatase-like [Nomia melanderi]XP_031849234.1 7,8-dihydro-8-oxoguanine triphosphatase-like [Nomia melanderi]XP_031849243.1 7,8-dihydro-8-oxoguanine triphosphatase-like [Nomia melanderi]
MSMRKIFSLVFVRKATNILLGLKKRGFGKDKWNGFGGKVESGETILQGALRELKEECGLSAEDLRKIGILEFEFEGNNTLLEVHVFETYQYSGEITESEEMRPKWYNIKDIPFKQMWPDDEYWFPYMLREELFKGYFLYRGQDLILKHNIETVEELPVNHIP